MLPTLLTTIARATIYINGESTSSTISDAEAAGVILAILGVFMIPVLIIAVISIIATWKIFTKCGEAGWKSIIPIYNQIVLFRIVGINPIWILLAFVPFVGSVLFFLVSIVMNLRLSKGFGKSDAFAVGLIIPITSFIFECMLAFGKTDAWDPKKIDYSTFDFLNTSEIKAKGNPSAKASHSHAKSGNEDPWVEGK